MEGAFLNSSCAGWVITKAVSAFWVQNRCIWIKVQTCYSRLSSTVELKASVDKDVVIII